MRMLKKQRVKVCAELDKIQAKQDKVLEVLKTLGENTDATKE